VDCKSGSCHVLSLTVGGLLLLLTVLLAVPEWYLHPEGVRHQQLQLLCDVHGSGLDCRVHCLRQGSQSEEHGLQRVHVPEVHPEQDQSHKRPHTAQQHVLQLRPTQCAVLQLVRLL